MTCLYYNSKIAISVNNMLIKANGPTTEFK